MGSYTANYQLYMAAAAEQGWGDLVNGNFETIDSILKTVSNTATSAKTAAENADSKAEAAAKTAEWSQISGKPTYVMGLTRKDITLPIISVHNTHTFSETVWGWVMEETTISFQAIASRGDSAYNYSGRVTLTVVGLLNGTYSSESIYNKVNNQGTTQTPGSITIPAGEFIKSISFVYQTIDTLTVQFSTANKITAYVPYVA